MNGISILWVRQVPMPDHKACEGELIHDRGTAFNA